MADPDGGVLFRGCSSPAAPPAFGKVEPTLHSGKEFAALLHTKPGLSSIGDKQQTAFI